MSRAAVNLGSVLALSAAMADMSPSERKQFEQARRKKPVITLNRKDYRALKPRKKKKPTTTFDFAAIGKNILKQKRKAEIRLRNAR